MEGRYRFTLAHEGGGHWRLHRRYFNANPGQAGLFREMQDRELVKSASQGAGFGLSPLIERSLRQQQAAWLFQDPGRVWEGTRALGGAACRVRAVDSSVWPLRRGLTTLPAAVAAASAHDRVVVANLGLADEWRGRFYLFNPSPRNGSEQSLHFVDAMAEHVTPALTNVFLLGRLRARVTCFTVTSTRPRAAACARC